MSGFRQFQFRGRGVHYANGELALLTMLSVKYGSSGWLEKNAALCRSLNPSAAFEWIVVNNDSDQAFASRASGFRIVPGVPRAVDRHDHGSAHHAVGLMAGLSLVSSRYVLVIDHDFYVIRPDWIRQLLGHVQARRIAFFGSVWHPRWSYQPRGFPSVHFMLIDLEQVPVSGLDFRPDMNGNRLDALVSHPRWPIPQTLRTLLQVGEFRDTGWRVRQRYRRSGLRLECLVPHFDLRAALRSAPWLHRLAWRWWPDRHSPIPRATGAFTAQSFLRTDSVAAYTNGWEEFFWQDQPFAFHLRNVGRRGLNTVQDAAELDRLLERYGVRCTG